MMGAMDQVPIEQLQAAGDAMRAADTGLCDHFEPVDVSMLPPGFPAHGPLCGCSDATGWIDTNQLCRHCGRHPEVH
jgi:hypothetical protein